MGEPLPEDSLRHALARVVGRANYIADETVREHCSQAWLDPSYARMVGIIVPPSINTLSEAVRTIIREGYTVSLCEGGVLYISALRPEHNQTIIIDISRLDRVVEINTERRHVIVECGCTWTSLDKALREMRVKTLYNGLLAGRGATVGDALLDNSLFADSDQQDSPVDALLGLEIVRTDGSLVRTGHWPQDKSIESHRNFVFGNRRVSSTEMRVSGFPVKAALQLIPRPELLRPTIFLDTMFGLPT